MRKNIVKIRALAFALGAATIFSVTSPTWNDWGRFWAYQNRPQSFHESVRGL